MRKKKKYYAVAVGRKPGVYMQWFGKDGAEIQVSGFPRARFKGFASRKEAEKWINGIKNDPKPAKSPKRLKIENQKIKNQKIKNKTMPAPFVPPQKTHTIDQGEMITIYTDGGCINNPGRGGYGVVLYDAGKKKELTGGFRYTTNNRMELMACIVGLQSLKSQSNVIIYTDSKYVVNGMMKGWARRWRRNDWKRNAEEDALNADLWAQLLDLDDNHQVDFKWVKGHAGNRDNERCDFLAGQAMQKDDLPPDMVYEQRSDVEREV